MRRLWCHLNGHQLTEVVLSRDIIDRAVVVAYHCRCLYRLHLEEAWEAL